MSERFRDGRPDPDPVECVECGSSFNLAAQAYYDNTCPSCMRIDDPERLKRPCVICHDMEFPSDLKTVTGHFYHTGTERVPVCSEGCKEWAAVQPRGPVTPDLDKGEQKFKHQDDSDDNE